LPPEVKSIANVAPSIIPAPELPPIMNTVEALPPEVKSIANVAPSIIPAPELPPIMNTVEALPLDIGLISDILAPPTEAQIEAAPVAMEPVGTTSSFEINFNPQITINGNADSNTVSQMSNELSRLKAELMRELKREFSSMMADYNHNQRRTSLAT